MYLQPPHFAGSENCQHAIVYNRRMLPQPQNRLRVCCLACTNNLIRRHHMIHQMSQIKKPHSLQMILLGKRSSTAHYLYVPLHCMRNTLSKGTLCDESKCDWPCDHENLACSRTEFKEISRACHRNKTSLVADYSFSLALNSTRSPRSQKELCKQRRMPHVMICIIFASNALGNPR